MATYMDQAPAEAAYQGRRVPDAKRCGDPGQSSPNPSESSQVAPPLPLHSGSPPPHGRWCGWPMGSLAGGRETCTLIQLPLCDSWSLQDQRSNWRREGGGGYCRGTNHHASSNSTCNERLTKRGHRDRKGWTRSTLVRPWL